MVVFWDIDGTLLTTARAGIFAWQDALREVAGVSADLTDFDTAGHPDHGIARRLLSVYAHLLAPDPALVAALVERYEALLPAALHRRSGRVLPNVREVLDRLASEPGARSLLLTGNTRRGAAAKLSHYGLAGYFEGGAFSDGGGDRIAIARAAVAAGAVAPSIRMYVVGDTPHDVRCGAAIGARTIAVATGPYGIEQLAAERPWRVVPELPPAAAFLRLLTGPEPATNA